MSGTYSCFKATLPCLAGKNKTVKFSLSFSLLTLSHQMTGRKGRVVSDEDGSVQYESRSEADVPLDMLNIQEKVRFMNGEKVHLLLK